MFRIVVILQAFATQAWRDEMFVAVVKAGTSACSLCILCLVKESADVARRCKTSGIRCPRWNEF